MLKYICISDQHAGAPMSLLTPLNPSEFRRASRVTAAFAEALDQTLKQQDGVPQLIVLGDLLDLQFSERTRAVQSAIGHLEALNATGRFDKTLIATAGNHDHALWTDARLGLDVDHLVSPKDGDRYRKTTSAFETDKSVNSRLMDAIAKKAGFEAVDFRYPNIGFGTRDKAVFLHHGHFVEAPYRLISTLSDFLCDRRRQYLTVDEIAAENAGWLDFFWSSVGETGMGNAGYDLYQDLLTAAGFRTRTAGWSKAIAEKLSELLPLSGNVTLQHALYMATRVGFDATLGRFRDSERNAIVEALTSDGWEGLTWYLDGAAKGQIAEELRGDARDLTFVFGHTHKPFADRVVSKASEQPVKVYNTGGWTLNGPRLDNRSGAGMVLIDEDLNVVSVRVLGTPQNGEVKRAFVECVSAPDGGARTFAETVHGWISQAGDAWDHLAAEAKVAYDIRQKLLLDQTNPDAVAS